MPTATAEAIVAGVERLASERTASPSELWFHQHPEAAEAATIIQERNLPLQSLHRYLVDELQFPFDYTTLRRYCHPSGRRQHE